MKNLFVYLIAVLISVNAVPVKAQEKLKEGKLTFEISYPDADDMSDQILAMMPKDMIMYFNGSKSHTEVKMSFGSTITIADDAKKESVVCMDMMNKKTAMKYTPEDAEKDKADLGDYDVKITDATKKIAGYVCKKAVVTYKKDNSTMDVWFTNDIAAYNSSRNTFKGIDGFMMEFTTAQKGWSGGMIKMKMTCTKVEKVPVSDDMFKIPDGFTVMTRDEVMQQFQQRKAATPRDNINKTSVDKDSVK